MGSEDEVRLSAASPARRVPTGLDDLDRLTSGLALGDLVVLGGAPGVGRTTIAATIALGAACSGHRVTFLTCEETTEEARARFLAMVAHVPYADVLNERLAPSQSAEEETTEAAGVMGLLDVVGMALPTHRDVRELVGSEERPELVVVDSLALMGLPSDEGNTKWSSFELVGESVRQLKAIALDMDVALLLTAPLARAQYQGKAKEPRMSDLYGTSVVEQAADVVLLVGVPDQSQPQLVSLSVAKDRHGALGSLPLCLLPGMRGAVGVSRADESA